MRTSVVTTVHLALLLPFATAAQAIEGRVVESGSGATVAAAVIALVDTAGEVVARAEAAGDGTFALVAPGSGVFAVAVGADGYLPARTRALEIPPAVTLPVEVRIARAPIREAGEEAVSGLPQVAGPGVYGVVVDAGTREPIPEARISLAPVGRGRGARADADAEGRFHVVPPRAGAYEIRAERAGFSQVTMPRLELTPGDTVVLEIALSTEGILLAPVTVVAASRRLVGDVRLAGFEWRRRAAVSGYFMDPEDVRRTNPMHVSDILAQARGIEVSGSGWRRTVTMRQRMSTFASGRRCVPNLYVDGVLVRVTAELGINDVVSGSSIAAVEVYEGPSLAAAEFPPVQNPFCGVVVLWTRPPGS